MKQAIGLLLILAVLYVADRLMQWQYGTFTPLMTRRLSDGYHVMVRGQCYTRLDTD